jgi:hypothetical protein
MTAEKATLAPRRIVLLSAAEHSDIEKVLREYVPPEPTGTRLHSDLQELATEHVGGMVAAEWFGPLGWTRFLWCKR